MKTPADSRRLLGPTAADSRFPLRLMGQGCPGPNFAQPQLLSSQPLGHPKGEQPPPPPTASFLCPVRPLVVEGVAPGSGLSFPSLATTSPQSEEPGGFPPVHHPDAPSREDYPHSVLSRRGDYPHSPALDCSYSPTADEAGVWENAVWELSQAQAAATPAAVPHAPAPPSSNPGSPQHLSVAPRGRRPSCPFLS